jgi:hypothetical protein
MLFSSVKPPKAEKFQRKRIDEFRVVDEIPSPQTSRLLYKTKTPFETVLAHPERGRLFSTGKQIKGLPNRKYRWNLETL